MDYQPLEIKGRLLPSFLIYLVGEDQPETEVEESEKERTG